MNKETAGDQLNVNGGGENQEYDDTSSVDSSSVRHQTI